MKILVVNDDGIQAKGIVKLAEMAKELGEVYVVAPDGQCSAMSQRITVRSELTVKKCDFPVDGVTAYSVSGTPADCVKVAVEYLLDEKPDVVFSGINMGYNVGYEVSYSGTVGAAMEAVLKDIPAIAFSLSWDQQYDVADKYLLELTKELLKEPIAANEIWNVNIPSCSLDEFKGILKDRTLAQTQYYLDQYLVDKKENDTSVITLAGYPIESVPKGTDLRAVLDGYISVGKVRNLVKEI